MIRVCTKNKVIMHKVSLIYLSNQNTLKTKQSKKKKENQKKKTF